MSGIRIVQYRAKRGEIPEIARALRERTRRAGALFVVNDDWKAAIRYDADGVHLGPGNPGFEDARAVRARLGDRLVGLSCGTVEEARAAEAAGADYAGVGPVYATASKADAGTPLGPGGLARIAAATALPVAAIGGIEASSIGEVRGAGVAMAAVISALSRTADPEADARALVSAWNGAAAGVRA